MACNDGSWEVCEHVLCVRSVLHKMFDVKILKKNSTTIRPYGTCRKRTIVLKTM